MKVSTYAKKLAKDEIKQNKFYIGVLSFAIFIMIIFMHMVIQGPTNTKTADFMEIIANSFPYMLAVAASVLAMLMVFYANELYLMSHQNELGLLSVCGGKVGAVAKYVFVQNMVFLMYALPLALLASFVVLPILQVLSNVFFASSVQVFSIQPKAYLFTLLLLAMMLLALLMGNTGFIYRHDIKELLGFYKAKETFVIEYPFKKAMSMIGCTLPLIGICFLPAAISLLFGMLVFAACTTQGFLSNVVIPILSRVQRKHYLHAKKTIIYAHVKEMLKNHLGPINLVNAAFMIVPMLLLSYQEDMHMFSLVFIFFVASLCMSGICLQHRLSETALLQNDDFQCLMDLGYDEIRIRQILKSEVRVYYLMIFMLPLIYTTAAFIKLFVYGLVSVQTLGMIVIALLLFMILNMVVSNILFQHYTIIDKGENTNE